MKLQYKIFRTLNNPVETQVTESGITVEIHSMNDTPYLARHAGKGQFAVWTSDSKSYKLLIENGYYQVMKDLYSKRVNQVWINFYEAADKIRFGLLYKMVFPMIGVSMLIALLFSSIPQLANYQSIALIVILAFVLVTNMLQTSMMRKRVDQARSVAIDDIKRIIGGNKFETILANQGKYYDEYFKFEDKKEDKPEVTSDTQSKDKGSLE